MKHWIVVAAAMWGCHKSPSQDPSAGASPATAELDALWAKAPKGAAGGVVASPRAIELAEHAWHDVHAFLRTLPAFTPAEEELVASLAKAGLSSDFTLADLGLAPGKGAAMFVMEEGKDVVLLLPVVDRDKFLAKTKGTKGTSTDHISELTCTSLAPWYACASNPAVLATLGTDNGALRHKLDAVKARGDIEGVAFKPDCAGVVQVDRGAIVMRGVIAGVPPMVASKLGPPVKPQVDLEHTAGFAVINVASFLADVPPAVPIVAGVTVADLVHSIGGPLRVSVTAGELAIDARVALNDSAPAKKLVEHCAELPSLGAKLDGDTCHVPVAQYGFTIDVWVEGKELRLGTKASKSAPGRTRGSAIGAEIANGEWQIAMWGHGTVLAPFIGQLPVAGMPSDQVATVLRAMTMMNEIGIAAVLQGNTVRVLMTARTAWANPDDVITKIEAVPAEDLVAGKGGEHGKAIAGAAPGTPFAGDFEAGVMGLTIPTAVVGVLAAVAVPAFVEYMGRSKRAAGTFVQMTVKKYAFEAYPAWAMAHPDKTCPDSLAELAQYSVDLTGTDPWGQPYRVYCGSNLPPGVKGLGVSSLGPDGKEGTDDDLKSWE